jgi:hypothetical protein
MARQRQPRDKTQTHYQGEIGDDETMAIKRVYETFDTFSPVQVVASLKLLIENT